MKHNFVLIGRKDCMYCSKAVGLLREKGKSVNYYSLEDAKWVLDLFRKSDIKTVPQIWTADGEYIGGYNQLVTYIKGEKV